MFEENRDTRINIRVDAPILMIGMYTVLVSSARCGATEALSGSAPTGSMISDGVPPRRGIVRVAESRGLNEVELGGVGVSSNKLRYESTHTRGP